MKFVVNKGNLKPALDMAKRIITGKMPFEILESVRLVAEGNSLTITASDSEISYQTCVPAEVVDAGAVCIPLKRLSSMLSSLSSGQLEFVDTEDKGESAVKITHSAGRYILRSEGTFSFPFIPVIPGDNTMEVEGDAWAMATARVLIATAAADMRPNYAAIYMELQSDRVKMAATDTYRLAVDVLTNDSDTSWPETQLLIPAKLLTEINRSLVPGDTLSISWHNGMIKFSTPGWTFTGHLIDARFPQYERIIPATTGTSIYVERMALQSAVRRAELFREDGGNAVVRICNNNNVLQISADGTDGTLKEEISMQRPADDVQIRLTARYLLDALPFVGSTVRLDIVSDGDPCAVRDDDYLYLLLPVKRLSAA